MKRHIFYFFLAATLFTACEKNDGSIPNEVTLERIPQPQVVKIAAGSQAIDVLNLSSFKGTFSVGLYSATDAPPTKFDVVIMKNGNRANIKLFKEDVATFPTTLDITTAQLATLFGAPVLLADNYDIGVDIYTQSGKKYEAFPALSNAVAYGSGIAAQPGSSTTARYSAICQYDGTVYQGKFLVVTDDWADYLPGDVVDITKIDDTHFSFNHIAAVNSIPVIVTVNVNDNSVSIVKQTVGTRWSWSSVYTAPFIATTGAASVNYVAPCDKTVTLNMQYGHSAGTFTGAYPLVLIKQ